MEAGQAPLPRSAPESNLGHSERAMISEWRQNTTRASTALAIERGLCRSAESCVTVGRGVRTEMSLRRRTGGAVFHSSELDYDVSRGRNCL
jgi:hypothetical protein